MRALIRRWAPRPSPAPTGANSADSAEAPARSAVRVVANLEREATRAWAAAVGGQSACALAKSGQSHPAAKFHEGAAAALAGLARALRADRGDPRAMVEQAQAAWTEQNAAQAARSRDWAAYEAGGAEALAGALSAVIELTEPPRLEAPERR